MRHQEKIKYIVKVVVRQRNGVKHNLTTPNETITGQIRNKMVFEKMKDRTKSH